VNLAIFDILGTQIEVLTDGFRSEGRHQIVWNAAKLPAGPYFYRLLTDRSHVVGTGVMIKY
jgi:hypothetical protein